MVEQTDGQKLKVEGWLIFSLLVGKQFVVPELVM